MKKSYLSHLLLPFLVVLALVALTPSCQFDQVATQPQIQQMEQLADSADVLQGQIEPMEDRAEDLLSDIPAAVASGDTVKVQALTQELLALQTQLESAYLAHDTVVSQMNSLAQDTLRPQSQVVQGWASAIHPGLGILVGTITPLFGGLFFRRSRKHMLAAASNMVRLNVGEALAKILKATGWKHTDDEFMNLLNRAKTLSFEAGDTEATLVISEALELLELNIDKEEVTS